ncbi:MAG: ECF transporter S component [Clostridiales Family XIII bacterium]|nr:ECF transporter S component [Clostridiales Family XIII bacterium]
MNRNTRLRKLTAAALVAALVFIVTFLIRIPIPVASGGYVNLGDTVIYLGALILGGWPGAAAAAVGSALSDLIAGYVVYAPATFIIKGLMGLVCGLLARRAGFARFTVAALMSGAVMVAGYFLFEALFFNLNQAIVSVPFNLMQWIGGVIAALALYPAARRVRLDKE